MIIESELREQMAKAVRHGGHLSDLYSWLMARSLNVHKDSSPSAARLALELESLFFDRSDGELADIDLRRAITVLLNRVEIRLVITKQLAMFESPVTNEAPVKPNAKSSGSGIPVADVTVPQREKGKWTSTAQLPARSLAFSL